MPIEVRSGLPAVCIRRAAFERIGLTRRAVDAKYALTADEFSVEGELIVVGPLPGDAVTALLADLEASGLEYYDDYFDLSGNWPPWLTLYAMYARSRPA